MRNYQIITVPISIKVNIMYIIKLMEVNVLETNIQSRINICMKFGYVFDKIRVNLRSRQTSFRLIKALQRCCLEEQQSQDDGQSAQRNNAIKLETHKQRRINVCMEFRS